MKNVLLIALVAILVLFVSYQGCQSVQKEEEFREVLDSLDQQNDSLEASILSKDVLIDSLEVVDSTLISKLDDQKVKVIKIIEFVDSSKQAIDTYSEQELISLFNNRYPEDTVSNPLALAQPVLTFAAKDLVEFDGAKQLLVVKDSTISIQQDRINTKDAVINEYISKESDYVKIIANKSLALETWSSQYDQLQKENKKLKKKSKIQKVVATVVAGSLAIWLIAK
jgi:hypothetical protein